MTQYIDKSALVAEIERLYAYFYCLHERRIIETILSNIDTLEVKEVDFETEWKKYFEHKGNLATVNVKDLAKHFFELGMQVSNKIQKGE